METLTTVQNSHGDVATYIVQDDKHTMFTFNASTNVSELSTITKVPEGYAFFWYSDGFTMNDTWHNGFGENILKHWQDVARHLDVVCERDILERRK